MEALLHLITSYGWLAVVLVIFSESGLMVGFFMPGDSLLFTSGFLVQQGILKIDINVFVLLLFLAAVLGNSLGYLIGRTFGRGLFERKSRLFKQKYLHDAEKFYEKHGPKTIIIAMFVPIVRAFVPVVAGTASMDYKKFVTFNVVGAALWTGSLTYLGYFVGERLIKAGLNIEIIVLLIVGLSLLPAVVHWLSKPKNRQKINKLLNRSK